jgi:hypothetical protein
MDIMVNNIKEVRVVLKRIPYFLFLYHYTTAAGVNKPTSQLIQRQTDK